MEILYISSSPSYSEYKNIESKVKPFNKNNIYGMPEASYKFHKLIIEGLIKNKCHLNSLIGRSVSNKTHYGIFWKTKKEKIENVNYRHVGFINFPVLKQICIMFGIFFNGFFWLIKNRKNKDKLIIIDGAYVSLIPVINFLTLFIKTNKIAIICDVYSYMADVEDATINKKKSFKFLSRIIKMEYQKLDGFIFLTEEMKHLPAFKNKPYKVIEGLVDNKIISKKKCENYVMYAGALRTEYGLNRLVNAFHQIKDKNIKLLLFGNGGYVDEILKFQKKDQRIKYMGKKSLNEIYEYERNAKLLINPRLTNYEFTKYSFPSKNMEYMLSGTPLLTGKLPGMPEEYNDYVFLIDDDSETALLNALNIIIKKSDEELIDFGKRAQDFIYKNKNKEIQAAKILQLNKEINIKSINNK